MLSKEQIIIIVIVCIVIVITILFLTYPTFSHKQLKDDASTHFGINVQPHEGANAENFLDNGFLGVGKVSIESLHSIQTVETLFATPDDIVKNMGVFCIYAFPLVFGKKSIFSIFNVSMSSQIDDIVKQSGVYKTSGQIFLDNQNRTFIDYTNKLPILRLLLLYQYILLEETNSDELLNARTLLLIVTEAFTNFQFQEKIQLPALIENSTSSTAPDGMLTITDYKKILNKVDLVLSPNLNDKDKFKLYLVTNLNKNILMEDGINRAFNVADGTCLVSKLCFKEISIQKDFKQKNEKDDIETINDFFILLFAQGLLRLEKKDLTPDNLKKLNEAEAKLTAAGTIGGITGNI